MRVQKQLQLYKGGSTNVFRCNTGSEAELVYCMIQKANQSKGDRVLLNGPGHFDYFDADVLAYKLLEAETGDYLGVTQAHVQLYAATQVAVKLALESMKIDKVSLEMLIEKYGAQTLFELNAVQKEQQQRINILCNDIVGYLKRYFPRIQRWAA